MNETVNQYGRHSEFDWPKFPPFVVNPRGVLMHRVRSVRSFLTDGEPRHFNAHYWCGNSCNFTAAEGILVVIPPEDKLLCAVCELKAVQRRHASADVIAGRHVHIGHLRAVRDCCQNDKN